MTAGWHGAAAFAFAHQLRDHEFRAYLKRAGHVSGLSVVAVGPEVSWADAAALADAHPEDGRRACLLARQDPRHPHGWELRRHETGGTPRRER